jgi:hypothetical protein
MSNSSKLLATAALGSLLTAMSITVSTSYANASNIATTPYGYEANGCNGACNGACNGNCASHPKPTPTPKPTPKPDPTPKPTPKPTPEAGSKAYYYHKG